MKKFRPYTVAAFLLVMSALLFSKARCDENNLVTIMLSQTVDHPALDATRRGIYDGLKKAGYIEHQNLKWVEESAQGTPMLATQIAQKFVSMSPSIIVALGTMASQPFLNLNESAQIPVVFSSVTDPLDTKLVQTLETPSGFITGVSNMIDLAPQIQLIQEIVPEAKRIGVIYNPGEINSVSMIEQLKKLEKTQQFQLVLATAQKTADVASAAQSLVGKVDVIFITVDNTALSAFESIARVAVHEKIPLFAGDVDLIDRGAVAALGPDQYELGLQTAEMIVEVLNGVKPATLPVRFPSKIDLVVNKEAADKINLVIPESVMKKASKPKDKNERKTA